MKVSVIVPVWNGYPYLAACLDALLAQKHAEMEIIVVDDASQDESAAFIAAHYPAVRLISLERNRGFAGACNVGLRAARGALLVLLNQDTEVQAGWLAALAACFSEDPSVGVAGSKALYPDGRVQHAGGYVDLRGETGHYGRGEVDTAPNGMGRACDFVTGASFAISRAAWERVGLFDEQFGAGYYEDVDWCYRARAAGFQVYYQPASVLVHKEVSTPGQIGYPGMLRFQRNRLRFVLKHWEDRLLLEAFLPAERAWLTGLGEGAEMLVAAARGAYYHHLLHWDEILRQRALFTDQIDGSEPLVRHVLTTLRDEMPWEPSLNAQPVPAAPGNNSDRWLSPAALLEVAPVSNGITDGSSPPRSQEGLREVIQGVRALLRRARFVFSGRQEMLDTRIAESASWTVGAITELACRQRRLPEVLVALIHQNAREIDALTSEVRRLRALLDAAEQWRGEGTGNDARSGH